MSETARAAMLTRIRQSLAQPAPLPSLPDFTTPVHPPLAGDDVVAAFAASFQRVGGAFYYCETLAELGVQLTAFLAGQQLARLFVWEPAMQALLTAAGVPFIADETEFLAHAEAGLTSCAALVARTGSVVVAANTAAGRRLSIYPDQHLVLARPGQVVAEIGEGLAAAGPASMLSLTTGPSRTADIEKTLVLGAHGPRKLTLFLLEDDAWDR